MKSAWEAVRLGIDPAALKQAIEVAASAKAALTDPDQKRWGQYSIQRVFLGFLDRAGVREELVPGGRGEVVFYNLGKFSQVISDFETIHFQSKPVEKYESFAAFLQHRADDAYPEGWQDNQYATLDAVRIMTIHQAKGMQWPVVFVPAMLRNRFPAARIGGRNVWHLLPRAGIRGQPRFEGTIEDERRLFYVAMTRSQKYLHLTWAPIPGKNNRYSRVSDFWNDVLASKYVKRRAPDYSTRSRPSAKPPAPVLRTSSSRSPISSTSLSVPTSSSCASSTVSMRRSTRRSATASRCTMRWPRSTLAPSVAMWPTRPKCRGWSRHICTCPTPTRRSGRSLRRRPSGFSVIT